MDVQLHTTENTLKTRICLHFLAEEKVRSLGLVFFSIPGIRGFCKKSFYHSGFSKDNDRTQRFLQKCGAAKAGASFVDEMLDQV
jgi:hypothetical protein